MKNFNGKAIYNPSGKAQEYSYWACNFYVGCSNMCSYCYCKKGILADVMGQNKPQLKKCFKNEDHALELFYKELLQNKEDLQKHGLFFTFTSDPFLKETIDLTHDAIGHCHFNIIPVKILTKTTWWVDDLINDQNIYKDHRQDLIAYGFTLTGYDELEPGASSNLERINAIAKLHTAGFKTLASIEPIIDIESSRNMIEQSLLYCDHYKIGLESGKKYNSHELQEFWQWCIKNIDKPIYFKDSFLKEIGIDDRDMMNQMYPNCVNRDFNMFKLKDLHS